MSATTLFLCGDVMTGRGVDQILAEPGLPRLYESYLTSAEDYVRLAEARTGPLPRRVDPAYVWGDALGELAALRPHARIVNLETAITTAEDAWPDKGIHYRMHPANVSCLAAAGIDCCVLANNHVLDWGHAGLEETLRTLRGAGIAVTGAGSDADAARAPAVIAVPGGRVVVFAYALASAGVTSAWAATAHRPGVAFLDALSDDAAAAIARDVAAVKRPGDIVVVSMHWGGNWGYAVAHDERAFAHRLIAEGGVDLVHGHSSHHPKGIEVHAGKLVLYGCGDFLNDYEGIEGYEGYRGDLTLMYFPTIDAATGRLAALTMSPLQIRHFRLNRPSATDSAWLRERLDVESRRFDCSVQTADGRFRLTWRA